MFKWGKLKKKKKERASAAKYVQKMSSCMRNLAELAGSQSASLLTVSRLCEGVGAWRVAQQFAYKKGC